MCQSKCSWHVNKISILIYKWVISIVVTTIPCYKLKINVTLFTQRVYVAMILDIRNVNRLNLILNHLRVTFKKCLCHRWQPICSMVLFVYFIFSCLLLTTIELHLFFFRGHYFEGGKERVWARKNVKYNWISQWTNMFILRRSMFRLCACIYKIYETRWITDLKHENM